MTDSGTLRAHAVVALDDAGSVLEALAEHLRELGEVTTDGRTWSFDHEFGHAVARLTDDGADFHLTSPDSTSLAYLQMGIANHLRELAERVEVIWRGDSMAGAPLPYFREMRVVSAANVTPRMRRVRLKGERLERFAHGGLHVRLLLPPEEGVEPVWPVMAADGNMAWPEGPRPILRVYTIRRIEAAEGIIDIDIVSHGDEAPGSAWAASARPGDLVGMTGPGGGGAGEADFYLLAGDETALPAIGRILEEMPAGRKVVARIEIADSAERQHLHTSADLDLGWLERNGRPPGTTSLLPDAVRQIEFPLEQRVFGWVGCEYAAFREIRSHLREERKLERREHLAVAYWRRGKGQG